MCDSVLRIQVILIQNVNSIFYNQAEQVLELFPRRDEFRIDGFEQRFFIEYERLFLRSAVVTTQEFRLDRSTDREEIDEALLVFDSHGFTLDLRAFFLFVGENANQIEVVSFLRSFPFGMQFF